MFLTPKQLAGLLGVTPQCITAWCRAGYMHGDAHLVNGRWVIRWSELLRTSLPVIGNRVRPDGQIVTYVGKRPRGRPPGSRNRRPYPKGVKRPRKKS
jgi:hypothetical protein